MSKVIRILYVNGGLMNRGGIESYMMNYYRNFDRGRIQIDFVVHDAGGCGYYDDEIYKLGGQIFALPQKSKHPFSYTSKLKAILIEGKYKIIHTHMDAMGAWVLRTAMKCGIPVRIAHSHNTQHLTTNPLKLFFLELALKNINRYATHRMACSNAAGEWLFGNEPFIVVKNAIDVDKFKFNPKFRKSVRQQYNIKDNFLIGHIGRFDMQKNHTFLIDVFYEVHKTIPKSKLMLIGEGHLMEYIKKKVSDMGLKDNVIFIGVRDDANLFYNAFDLFVLPSLFEGLPVVAIETQINGCPLLLSSEITNETQITPNVQFVSLDKNEWLNKIIFMTKKQDLRNEAHFDLSASGYDIRHEALKLQELYIELWNKN